MYTKCHRERKTQRNISQIWKTRGFVSTPRSIASCPLPLIPSSISLFLFIPTPPLPSHPVPSPPLWVNDTQGAACVCLCLCAQAGCCCHQEESHLLLTACSKNTLRGNGKILMGQVNKIRTRIHKQTLIETAHSKTNTVCRSRKTHGHFH